MRSREDSVLTPRNQRHNSKDMAAPFLGTSNSLTTSAKRYKLAKFGKPEPSMAYTYPDDHGCRAIYPIVWLCYEQSSTNLISQAGQMITYGIPNDAMQTLNPICVLITVPLFESYVYPYMHKVKLSSRPTVRMALGFVLTAASMAIAAGVQQAVYNSPPCYSLALECQASENGGKPNQVSVLLQLPVYILGALGEVLWQVSGSEYAYNKAAPHMKSTLQAVTMLTVALNAALGLAVSPAAHNPNLTILFASFAGAMFGSSVVFSLLFWRSD